MAYGEPTRMAARRDYRTYRTRSTVLGVVLGLLVVAASIAAAWHLFRAGDGLIAGRDHRSGGGALTRPSPSEWPSHGQAAVVVGDGRPAVSPHQEPAPIASLAKVMTAYLTLKRDPLRGGDPGFTMTVSAAQAEAAAEEADEGQSVVPVAAGERLTERQLLEALLIASGNNIARMLAVVVGGSEADFGDAMNAEARALGMDQTTYTDPSGFDPGTVSTAADQLGVFRRAMRSPAFRRIVSMASATLPVAGTLTNFNPLIDDGYGGKTGSDSAAGGCLAFFTEVAVGGHSRTAVGVVMGQGEGSDTAALLEAAGDAAEGLVDSVAQRTGTGGVAFRGHLERDTRVGNAPPPKLAP